MKKLMFAAAVAATASGVFADSAAQVYDVTLSIKSTAAYMAKNLNHKTNPRAVADPETPEDICYRKQASFTWKGYVWACDCESIRGLWEVIQEYQIAGFDVKTVGGTILWDSKNKEIRYLGNGADISDPLSAKGAEWGWDFINSIDKKGDKVEGLWNITSDGDPCGNDPMFVLTGAGFGTVKDSFDYDKETKTYSLTCQSYIKSISGNFAGYMPAPTAESAGSGSGCWFCGTSFTPGATCIPSDAWEWCDCDNFLDIDKTAAYGTWKMAYNSSLSKKLSTSKLDKGVLSILDIAKLPAGPAAAVALIEESFRTENVETAYQNAKSAYDIALNAMNVAIDELDIARVNLAEAKVVNEKEQQAVNLAKLATDTENQSQAVRADALVEYTKLTGLTAIDTAKHGTWRMANEENEENPPPMRPTWKWIPGTEPKASEDIVKNCTTVFTTASEALYLRTADFEAAQANLERAKAACDYQGAICE